MSEREMEAVLEEEVAPRSLFFWWYTTTKPQEPCTTLGRTDESETDRGANDDGPSIEINKGPPLRPEALECLVHLNDWTRVGLNELTFELFDTRKEEMWYYVFSCS